MEENKSTSRRRLLQGLCTTGAAISLTQGVGAATGSASPEIRLRDRTGIEKGRIRKKQRGAVKSWKRSPQVQNAGSDSFAVSVPDYKGDKKLVAYNLDIVDGKLVEFFGYHKEHDIEKRGYSISSVDGKGEVFKIANDKAEKTGSEIRTAATEDYSSFNQIGKSESYVRNRPYGVMEYSLRGYQHPTKQEKAGTVTKVDMEAGKNRDWSGVNEWAKIRHDWDKSEFDPELEDRKPQGDPNGQFSTNFSLTASIDNIEATAGYSYTQKANEVDDVSKIGDLNKGLWEAKANTGDPRKHHLIAEPSSMAHLHQNSDCDYVEDRLLHSRVKSKWRVHYWAWPDDWDFATVDKHFGIICIS